jgi:hypothetical protein
MATVENLHIGGSSDTDGLGELDPSGPGIAYVRLAHPPIEKDIIVRGGLDS